MSSHEDEEVKKVEDKVNENKKEIIFVRGFFSYKYHSDLVYDCKLNLIKTHSHGILEWKPKNIYDPSYKYKGYGICFDESEGFSHVRKEGNFNHTTLAKNVIIFGADIGFSKHTNNKANNIYVIGKDCIQKINDTIIYAEKMFYRNFTDQGKKFILSLHYNGDNSYLFVNGREELKFKTKIDQIINKNLCLGTLSHDWTRDQSTKTSLYGNIYDFVVDYA